jgi:hypothetical protein
MQKLIDSGLFGGGLTSIATPELVSRYNECLGQLGIPKTSLDRFQIDGIGWSPEIALERSNTLYLSAGPANPMGVIVTPDQRGKPVWHPFTSYDRRMMDAYFGKHHEAIADITASRYIGLDFDAELLTYEKPNDLLLVTCVILRSVAGGLFDAGKQQRKLVKTFMEERHAWFNPALRNEIIASGRTWGDLRYRNTNIPDMKFDVGSFYTTAFGGVFVLRPVKGKRVLLILEDTETALPQVEGCDVFSVNDPKLPSVLHEEGFVEISTAWYARHQDVLADKKEGILVSVAAERNPVMDFIKLKQTQRRQLAMQCKASLPPVYLDLERFAKRIKGGERLNPETLSDDLSKILMRPHHRLETGDEEVIWLLLCRLQPLDVSRLYASDKQRFFREYETWPDAKKDWAINVVRESNLQQRTNQEEGAA